MEHKRLSIIDGSVENVIFGEPKKEKKLVPKYEIKVVDVLTLEGLEQQVQKVLVGYVEEEI